MATKPRKAAAPAEFPTLTCGRCAMFALGKCWVDPHELSHTDEDGTQVYLKRGAPCDPNEPRCRDFSPRINA